MSTLILRAGCGWFAVGAGALSAGGCGSSSLPVDALQLDTWLREASQADGEGEADDDAGDVVDAAGAGAASDDAATPGLPPAAPDTPGGGTVVRGESIQRPASPVLEVDPEGLSFGTVGTVRSFVVRNTGGGTMDYGATADVAWATVDPASGSNAGGDDTLTVTVERSGLVEGNYAGTIEVVADDGQSRLIVLTMEVEAEPALPPAPALVVAGGTLDFGSDQTELVLRLSNGGGGTVVYTVEVDAAWVTAAPSSGELSTETDTVTVSVARAMEIVGSHSAQVTVRGDDGSVNVLPLTMEKPNTFPLTVPWLELGLATPEDLQVARDGLVHWRRVTDTVVLLAGPNQAFAYTTLQAEFPGLTIIPSIKSSPRTAARGLDSIEAWQLMAADIAVVCAATGVNQVVLENETATRNYLHGTETIDLEQFRQALAYLPTNIEIIWYPGVSVSTDAALVARSVALCQVVEDVLHPRFADISFGDPDWPVYPPSWYAREMMDNMAQQPTMPIVWVGYPSGQYWEYVDLPVAMEQIATLGETPADYPRPSYLLYMGQERWVEASQAVAELLWPSN